MAAGDVVHANVDVPLEELDPQQQKAVFLKITRATCAALGIELGEDLHAGPDAFAAGVAAGYLPRK